MGMPINTNTCFIAARHGLLEGLAWANEKDLSMTREGLKKTGNALAEAAHYGHLDAVIFLKE
jgi:hypothetical protein